MKKIKNKKHIRRMSLLIFIIISAILISQIDNLKPVEVSRRPQIIKITPNYTTNEPDYLSYNLADIYTLPLLEHN